MRTGFITIQETAVDIGRVCLSVCLSDDNFRKLWHTMYYFHFSGRSLEHAGQARIWSYMKVVG